MALFSNKDRIAIAVISFLIVTGWGVRYFTGDHGHDTGVKVIRNAVEPPVIFNALADSIVVDDALKEVININTAGSAELDVLPMIGPSRAAAIIEYRNNHGAFKKIEDIMNVRGIGEGIFREIQVHIATEDTLLHEEAP